MMKKICLLVAFFVLGKMWSYAQYPITQTLGSDSTIVISKGALQSRLINVTYADTTAANLQRIRQYPGAQIATTTGGLNLWVRNANATAWIPVATGSGNNIYTIDGTLLGNRTLSGANNNLTFNNLNKFSVNTNDSVLFNTPNFNIKNLSGDLSVEGTVTGATSSLRLKTFEDGDWTMMTGRVGLELGDLRFYDNVNNPSSPRLIIKSSGKVGIGTDSPDSLLTVTQGAYLQRGVRMSGLPSAPGTKQLRINAQGQLSVTDTLIDAGGTVTSVGTNNGSGITGGTITTSGTLAIDTTNVISTKANVASGLAGKLNISDTAAMLSPYLRSNTAAATYVPLTRTLTINGTTQDLSANRTYNVGTVTSVGLTMPAAFNVANSPVTSSGTLAVTGAGLVSQYIRGDGTLADFPGGGGGGGASISYYLNGSVNQGTFGGNTYYEMNKVPIFGAGTNFSINADGYIAQFITDAGDPGLLNIPAGNWNFELFFNASSSGGSPTYYVELYKYDGTTFTLIASGSTNPDAITGGTSVDAYFSTLPVPQTILTLTDRLAVRIYVTHSGRTITLHTEDNNLCQIITTFTTGITALNSLTAQVQYLTTGTSGTDFNISSSVATHTFNLPTASATNRGALSTTDWTTFNSKLSPADTVSLSNRINLKLNISDTASMLGNYLNNVGYGLSKAGQVASADSATLSAYYLRRKDSLTATNPLGYVTKKILSDTAAAIRSADAGGTVTSVATNNGTGITGGTITTSGTLAIDTLLVSTRAWRQKGVDSVAALANTKISGSLISGYLTKATGSLTIDTSQIYQNGQNVGIGTIVPDGRLAIVDTGGFALKIMYNSASTDANTNAALYAENNGLSSYVTIFNEKTTNNTGGQFPLLVESSLTSGTAQSGMATGIHFGVPDDAGNRKVTQLALRTTNAAAATYTNRAELRLWNNGSLSTPYYLLGNGNMGLGTSTPDSNLTVVNGAYFQRGIRASALPQAPGTKALRIDASGTISYADTLIDAGGTVTSVATNNGTGITGGTITTTGTLAIDTLLISTRAWRQKGIDSVASLINTAISGTTNYIPKFTSSSAIGNSIMSEGSGVINVAGNLATNNTNGILTLANGNTSGGNKIQSFNSTGNANGYLAFEGYSSEYMRISSTGNVSIGNTNNTYKLDVTGTLRVNTSGSDTYRNLLVTYPSTFATRLTIGASNFYIENDGSPETFTFVNTTGSGIFDWKSGASATQRMRLDASGNLGLGTSSPQANLHIQSSQASMNLRSTSTSSPYIDFYTSTSSLVGNFYALNGGGLAWGTSGGSEKMRLDNSGNLGLGVSPSAWGSSYRAIQGGNGSNGVGGSLAFFNNLANGVLLYSNATNDNTNDIYTFTAPAAKYVLENNVYKWFQAPQGTAGNAISFTQAMTLDASGNLMVGGTSSTGERLQITGASNFTGRMKAVEIGVTKNGSNSIGDGPWYRWTNAAEDRQILTQLNASNGLTTWSFDGANWVERYTLTNGGNVGIGTTSPTQKLTLVNGTFQIGGTSTFSDNVEIGRVGGDNNMAFATGGSERMRITSGGSVGIGTQTPDTYSYGGNRSFLTLAATATNQEPFLQLIANGTGNSLIDFGNATIRRATIVGFDGSHLGFYTNGSNSGTSVSERMRITSGGNVLIGTTTDSGLKLQVNGGNGDQLFLNNTGQRFTQINFSNNTVSKANIWWDNTNNELVLLAASSGVGDLKVSNSGGTTIRTTITTGAPSGGTAKPWKLGEAGVSVGGANTTAVKVEIDGVVYYLLTAYLPEPEPDPAALPSSGPSASYKTYNKPIPVKTTKDVEIDNLKKEIEELKQLIKNK